MALGATRRDIRWLIFRGGLAVVAAGSFAGLGGALALGRYARALLFEIDPADPVALGGAVAVMLAVASAAALIPARRAARVDPAVALKAE
jgi:ABC-type antimicrobial peptide transport system permease subunit